MISTTTISEYVSLLLIILLKSNEKSYNISTTFPCLCKYEIRIVIIDCFVVVIIRAECNLSPSKGIVAVYVSIQLVGSVIIMNRNIYCVQVCGGWSQVHSLIYFH
jgi:hypothetical protein